MVKTFLSPLHIGVQLTFARVTLTQVTQELTEMDFSWNEERAAAALQLRTTQEQAATAQEQVTAAEQQLQELRQHVAQLEQQVQEAGTAADSVQQQQARALEQDASKEELERQLAAQQQDVDTLKEYCKELQGGPSELVHSGGD